MVGHFGEVHDETDPAVRQRVTETLGTDIYAGHNNSNGASLVQPVYGPPNKVVKVTERDIAAVAKTSRTLDDWYAG